LKEDFRFTLFWNPNKYMTRRFKVEKMKVDSFAPELENVKTTGLKRSVFEKANFLYKFIQSPKRIGSITPSSDFLAQAMIYPIDWNNTRSIVELGAGTGIFTRYIQQLKHPKCQGIVFEQDKEMAMYLQNLYPGLHYHSRAEELYPVLQQHGLSKVDCILSGLPFMNFPQAIRERILNGVAHSLKPGGLFIQFQYSLQMKHQLSKRFTKVDVRFVPLNVPPAFVYYCYK
jgi:phospholipid N-methyltransferase